MNRQVIDHRHRSVKPLRALDPPVVNGIDYLEIASNPAQAQGGAGQSGRWFEYVYCRISGGVRITISGGGL